MPNGYTYKVAEGTTTFREFILDCARGFGFAIMQRDDPMDAPLTTHYEPNTEYYDKCIERAHEDIARFQTMSDAEADEAAAAAYAAALAGWEEQVANKAVTEQRYDNMTDQVRRWKVPAELAEMKQDILKWLAESKRSDCWEVPTPQRQSGPAYRADKLEQSYRSLAYDIKHRAKEIERTNERNRYLTLLVESLGEAV